MFLLLYFRKVSIFLFHMSQIYFMNLNNCWFYSHDGGARHELSYACVTLNKFFSRTFCPLFLQLLWKNRDSNHLEKIWKFAEYMSFPAEPSLQSINTFIFPKKCTNCNFLVTCREILNFLKELTVHWKNFPVKWTILNSKAVASSVYTAQRAVFTVLNTVL